jgi:hypothetical protein
MENRDFHIGDLIRVVSLPPHIAKNDFPYAEVRSAFEAALGKCYRIENIDWGGWVQLTLGQPHGGIGIQPDCVELVEPAGNSK